jgi:DivIVA domain-containing protein
MSIQPDDVAQQDFIVAPEGYDREEVRNFLEIIANEHRALRQQIEELRQQLSEEGAVGPEVALVLESAKGAAEEAVRLASKEAEELRGRAEDDAERLRRATIEASDRVRDEADTYAFETRAEADREARRRVDETNAQIETLLDRATRVRDRLVALDGVLGSVRTEVGEAYAALDYTMSSTDVPDAADDKVIDLREASVGAN